MKVHKKTANENTKPSVQTRQAAGGVIRQSNAMLAIRFCRTVRATPTRKTNKQTSN